MKRDDQFSSRIAASTSLSDRLHLWPTDGGKSDARLWQAEPERRSSETIQTVVVPLDGSTPAEHALPPALAIVRRTGASLRLIHAYTEPFAALEPWQHSSAYERTQVEHQDYLERIARQITRREDVDVEIVLVDSPDTIDALMTGVPDSSLVVIGSRRRRFASRLWWQNRVDQLRQRLSVPLLVTKGDSVPVELTAGPEAKRILLPLDGSVADRTVLDCARFAAQTHGGTITLLNVQNEEWTAGLFPHSSPREYLSWTIERLKQNGIHAEAYVLTSAEDPRLAIQHYAESHNTDLIAIPTHADRGLSRMMRSSVADSLLRHSKIPILLQSIPGRAKRPELTKVT
ncbi:universal stress protein [Schlesneria sp. DSM 10557]|uniref:universal stress protein n=1 Tax=Schlesneria sp. DSM 10557 TaxID=3044399 RepID=UPI0035A0A9CF